MNLEQYVNVIRSARGETRKSILEVEKRMHSDHPLAMETGSARSFWRGLVALGGTPDKEWMTVCFQVEGSLRGYKFTKHLDHMLVELFRR